MERSGRSFAGEMQDHKLQLLMSYGGPQDAVTAEKQGHNENSFLSPLLPTFADSITFVADSEPKLPYPYLPPGLPQPD